MKVTAWKFATWRVSPRNGPEGDNWTVDWTVDAAVAELTCRVPAADGPTLEEEVLADVLRPTTVGATDVPGVVALAVTATLHAASNPDMPKEKMMRSRPAS